MSELALNIPPKLIPLFTTDKRFIDIYGGRGSGKSWAIADFLISQAYDNRNRISCTREIQKSISDSVHKLLADRIRQHKLDSFFKITDRHIRGANGSEFLFDGLRHNPASFKSKEGIDYCWVEEAHSVSRKSIEILTPTIRKSGSQIIFSYNPTNENDPVHVDYTKSDRNDTLKIQINYNDNPCFPDVLRAEMEYDKRVDYDKYLHKWMGQCVKHSEAQVFYKKWTIDTFDTPDNAEFHYGADWGFSNDPNTLVRCYIIDNKLYIDHEAWGIGVDINKTPEMFDRVPESRRHMIIADSARPETISHMKNHGFNIRGAKKGKGSIEDGIQKIRGFEAIIIHDRCKRVIDEFRTYQWKEDRVTGEYLNVPEDKNNHCIDALRYALEGISKKAKITRW